MYEADDCRDVMSHGDGVIRAPNCGGWRWFGSFPDGWLRDRGVSDLQTYFTNSRWQGNLHLFLLPAADDFEPLGSGVFVDFTQETPKVKIMTADALKASYKTHSQDKELGINKLYMRVRSECLYYVICDMRPWEDFFLGMQCMIHRTPDRYNSDFWFYFTNVYIAGNPDITPLRTQAN